MISAISVMFFCASDFRFALPSKRRRRIEPVVGRLFSPDLGLGDDLRPPRDFAGDVTGEFCGAGGDGLDSQIGEPGFGGGHFHRGAEARIDAIDNGFGGTAGSEHRVPCRRHIAG